MILVLGSQRNCFFSALICFHGCLVVLAAQGTDSGTAGGGQREESWVAKL